MFDEQMINILELDEVIKVFEGTYGKKTSKAMTAAVLNYLRGNYPEK